MFFVRSEEVIPCPCCHERLKVIGSRRRGFLESSGEKKILIIRRLQCQSCKRIHHELPNILVPFKRYEAASIEEIVVCSEPAVAADESTLQRLRAWFTGWMVYARHCLTAIASQLHLSVEEVSGLPQSSLQSNGPWVSEGHGWLRQIVRPIANMNLWIHTRSAFLSE